MTEEQEKQITDLYLEMYNKLMHTALKNEENESYAEEAVQEVFRIACQHPERCCGCENPQGWLVKTLRYVILNAKRRRAAAKKYLEEYVTLHIVEPYTPENRINVDLLYQNVSQSEEWKLLSDMFVDGMTHKEMAQKYNISVSNCKKRVERAKKNLKKKLKKLVTL